MKLLKKTFKGSTIKYFERFSSYIYVQKETITSFHEVLEKQYLLSLFSPATTTAVHFFFDIYIAAIWIPAVVATRKLCIVYRRVH